MPENKKKKKVPVTTGKGTGRGEGSKATQFKAGAQWSGNAKGRPKGSRNEIAESFLSVLQKDFDEHGEAAIVEVRETRPAEYVKVVASLLPKELNVNTNKFEGMSDDDLAAGIAALQSIVASQTAGDRGEAETRH